MKLRLIPLTLLVAGLGSALAQNQVPGGTPLLVQPPQTQSTLTFMLAYPLLAMPETSPVPSQVKLSVSRRPEVLEVSGQPKGMTVTVTPEAVTVETKNVPVGQYPLRITARWGNDSRIVELLVAVYSATPGKTGATSTSSTSGQIITAPTPPVTTSTATTSSTEIVPSITAPINPGPTLPRPATQPATQATSTPAPAAPTPVVITAPVASVTIAPSPVTAPPPAPAPAPVTTPSIPTMQQNLPQVVPAPTTTSTVTVPAVTAPAPVTNASIPYQSTNQPASSPASQGRTSDRFIVWGGMGTERGIVGGLNVGVSSRVAQFNAFQVSVRGTAELYPSTGSGLGLPVIGADVLLNLEGSRLYYGPSTSLAFGAGNSWAIGGLVGYGGTWNKDLGYYVEGRARYAHLGGQNTLSPGFRVGFTYKLNR